jgi:hypothetical protein
MNRTTIRWLTALVIVMGVLIMAGLGALAYLIVTRSFASPAPRLAVSLAEPAGTRITAAALDGGVLVVTLSGGGPDRVVLIEAKSGRLLGRLTLAPAPLAPVP